MKKNRISKLNKKILLILALLKERGRNDVKISDVLKMINKSRASEMAPNNFRSTCWRMRDELGYINIMRDESNRLWCALTDKGVQAVQELNVKGE